MTTTQQTTSSQTETQTTRDDQDLRSLMTDISEWRPTTEPTEDLADWRMTLVG